MYKAGKLIRHAWNDGREKLCLLTALADDPHARPGMCSANLAPSWLLYLMPFIDDAGTEFGWGMHIERLIECLPTALRVLRDRDVSERCRSRVLAHIVREARENGSDIPCFPDVLQLLDRHGSGGEVSDQEWEAACQAAGKVADASYFAAEVAKPHRRMTKWILKAAEDAVVDTVNPPEDQVQRAADRLIDAIIGELEAL